MEKNCCQLLIEEGCKDATAFVDCARTLLNKEEYEWVIQCCEKAISINPNIAMAHLYLGFAKSHLGKYQESISDFNSAIQINPNYTHAFNNRGLAKSHLGKHEASISDFNSAIQINPNYASAYYNRGNEKAYLGRKEDAILDYDKAIQINPNHALVYQNRGNVKSELGRKEEAIMDYNRTIQINPNYAGAYYNRGIVKSDMGKVFNATLDYYRAADLFKNDFSDFSPITPILNHFHDHYSAPIQVQHIIASNPNLRSSLNYRKLVVENEHQCRAMNLWLAWLDIKYPKSNREAEWLRAWIYYHGGDPVSAFYLLDKLDDGTEEDFAQQYFFVLAAELIQHPEREEISDFAKKSALRFTKSQKDDDMQIYWAARLLMHCDEPDAALDCLKKGLGGEMYFYLCRSEAFEKAGMSGERSVELAKELPGITGIEATENIEIRQLKPNDSLKDFLWKMELSAQYYDLESKINAVFAEGTIKPRFWEIWDASALEGPVRAHRMEVLDTKIKAEFDAALKDSLEGKAPNVNVFKSETEKKHWEAYKLIKGSDDLVYEISQMIYHADYSKQTIADLMEYFYLAKKLPESDTFYLYFYLTVCKASKAPNAALDEGGQEAGKVIIEDLINKLLEYVTVGSITSTIGYLSGPLAAGAGLGLVIVARAFLKHDFSFVTKPYSKFKADFKAFIFKQYEELGEEQFYKTYPMRGFDDFKP